jgi:phosphatidylserine decarboxylase
MYIHKEGILPIIISFLVCSVVALAIYFLFAKTALSSCKWLSFLAYFGLLYFMFRVIFFFRMPYRDYVSYENQIIAPADGTVCIVEEVEEAEYFQDRRLQVSIFMSSWNIHCNRYPVSGKIEFYQYHPGKYFLANLPKSSLLNERTSIVINNPEHGIILVRQIAGFVARRIVCYATNAVGKEVNQTEELGFIRFGSRVDLYLPIGTDVKVKPGDKVKGGISEIGVW